MPGSKAQPIRILVADDDELLCAGVTAVLARRRNYSVCGVAANEGRVTEMVEQTKPQLLLLDLFLGHRDGIILIKDLSNRFPQLRILVLSDRDHETFAGRALQAGASGYLMKSASARQLLAAIDQVLRGEVYLAPRDRLLSQHAAVELKAEAVGSLRKLTDRELHVFQLIGLGLGTSSIALELGLSRKTIECYKERIKNKLGYADARALATGAQEWLSQSEDSYPSRAPFEAKPDKNRGQPPIRARRRSR